MPNNNYAVVEFVDEKSVEVVAKSWIETCDGDLHCYWPRTNVASRVKKLELPDKESWKSYNVRIFSYTDSLTKAKKFARKAFATSNIESDEDHDSNVRWKRACIRSSMEEFPDYSDTENNDDSDEQERPQLVHPQRAKLPLAPNFKPSCSTKSNQQLPPPNRDSCQTMEYPACDSGNDNTLPGSAMISALSQILSTNPSSMYSDLVTISPEDFLETQPLQEAPSGSDFQATSPPTCREQSQSKDIFNTRDTSLPRNSSAPKATPTSERYSRCPNETNNNLMQGTPLTSVTPGRRSQSDSSGFQRSVLTKLDTLIDKHEEALSILRVLLSAAKGVNDDEIMEDIIPNALDSVDELEELSSRLNDDDYRKKLLRFLGTLCANTCANSVRRIMARLGTNNLWLKYSFKGRKAKRPFKDLAVCKVVIRACLRVHKDCNEVNVEELIGEVLKYAPCKAGGSRFKPSQVRKSTAAMFGFTCPIAKTSEVLTPGS